MILSNYWSFIETYYPNYYSCDAILLSDILLRKLEGEIIDANDEALIEVGILKRSCSNWIVSLWKSQ